MSQVVAAVDRHVCLDAESVSKLKSVEARRWIGNCPVCEEFYSFYLREQRLALDRQSGESRRKSVISECLLMPIVDRFDLHKRDLVLTSFDKVISNTVGTLRKGQIMRLRSHGEILESRQSYAFFEIVSAVKRGVQLEYFIPGQTEHHGDITLLLKNMQKCVGKKTTDGVLVEHSDFRSRADKEVHYIDELGNEMHQVVEVTYSRENAADGFRRLWVRLPVNEAKLFLEALEQVQLC